MTKKLTKGQKELLDRIDKAQALESKWYYEGMRLKDIYTKKYERKTN